MDEWLSVLLILLISAQSEQHVLPCAHVHTRIHISVLLSVVGPQSVIVLATVEGEAAAVAALRLVVVGVTAVDRGVQRSTQKVLLVAHVVTARVLRHLF